MAMAMAMSMALAVPSLSPESSSILSLRKAPSLSPNFSVRFRRCFSPPISPPTELAPARNSPLRISRLSSVILHGRKVPRIHAVENGAGEGERDYRGESTLPERFRQFTKEAPEPPVRWPWLVAAGFLLYAWRAVLFELYNWKKAALALFQFGGYISKVLLAVVFLFIGDPITALISGIETGVYTLRAYYSSIVAYAPIQILTTMVILTSAVFAIAEATSPDSVSAQPYVLTVSGLVAYAAVANYISDLFFWTALVGLFSFARLVQKRDVVASALPVAVVLTAIGESWLRVLTIASYLALAMAHHSSKPQREKEEGPVVPRKLPLPLFGVALAIGVRLAANWAGYRHLTWMIA